jgi:hypothetical protein
VSPAGAGGGTVIVPWYATGFRGDRFEAALNEFAAVALRYDATAYTVYRALEDRYKFQQLATFAQPEQWERYWSGPEAIDFRARHSGWYQVPVIYAWWEPTASGAVASPPVRVAGGHGNGAGVGESA